MGSFTDNLRRMSLLEVMERATAGLNLVAAPQAQAAQFQCRCSRERAVASLAFFGMQERQTMMDDGGQEVICHWCNEHYQISPGEIAALDAPSLHAQA